MYSISVPHLFEIKTNRPNIFGFYFMDLEKLQNNNMFCVSGKFPKPQLIYSYEVTRDIEIPDVFEAMYRWYLLNDKKIYYERSIINRIFLKLIYNLQSHKLEVSPFYHSAIRFELGNIWPPGKILSNYIAYDLQKLGFGTFHGAAFKYKGKVVCIFAPGGNFKTPLLKFLIQKGAEYISGDKLIIKDGYVYFLPPLKNDNIFINTNHIATYKHKIEYVFFIQRSKNQLCVDLNNNNNNNNNNKIESYLQSFNIFNFLGSGWALNFSKIIDDYIPISNWYEHLGLNDIKHIKLIREENFDKLANLIIKELT